LWGAFRTGTLPEVRLVRAQPGLLEASVELPGTTHTRRIEWDDGLRIDDVVAGRGSHAVASRLVWAPGLSPFVEAEEEEGWVSERFFERVATRVSVQHVSGPLPLRLGWRIPRLQ
jgi:hypothetical protein